MIVDSIKFVMSVMIGILIAFTFSLWYDNRYGKK